MKKSTKYFPFYSFSGTHREIGRQYGEACRTLIHKHRDLALHRLKARLGARITENLKESMLQYRSYVLQYEKSFDEKIQGVAEGANIPLEEAYLIQLRAEAYQYFDSMDECTTFAVLPEATSNGVAMIGQNADLPAFYSELCVVIECKPVDSPAYLMLTPAGQISYIGINEYGLGCFANFLSCDGWRVGFPRYLFSALALTHKYTDEAVEAVRNLYRASSRNLIMLDSKNQAIDLETTPAEAVLIQPENGLLAHTNHYVSQQMLHEERGEKEYYENSCVRYDRMNQLLKDNHGKLNATVMMDIFRDRQSHPHNICMMKGDSDTTDSITVASVIAEPSKGQMWIAIGPPHLYEYKLYTLT